LRAWARWVVPALLLAALSLPPARAQAGEAPAAPRKVLRLEIDGEIDLGRSHLVERAVARAVREKPALLLLVVDSPGGRVDYMEKILRSVEKARVAGVRSAAWVEGNAWSAAAIIAIACDRIYMGPTASIGAAAPIFVTEKGIQMADEKFVSAMRTQARAMAERTRRPAVLAEAMVDKDTEVLQVLVDGEKRYVSAGEWEDLRNRSYREGFEATLERTVNPKGKLLSLSASQAVEFSMADGIAGDLDAVLAREGLAGAEVVPLVLTWSQHLANFLNSPVVSILLFILGIAGLYAEFKAPGFGLPGIVGIAALALFFFGRYTVGLAEAHEILLVAAGVALLIVEVFLVPGFGIPGILGIVMILAGFFLSSQDFLVPRTPEQAVDFRWNVIRSALTLLGTAGVIAVLANLLPRSPLFRRLELKAPITETSQTGSADMHLANDLLGRRGFAETMLRPSGKGRFGELTLDVVTEGDYVEPGQAIVVQKLEGNRIVVAAVRPAAPEASVDGR
jgi:membrane-bound serine protease (ClpP class)